MGQEPFHERDKAKIKKHCPPEHDGKLNGTGPMHMTFSQDPDDDPLDPAMRHKDHNGIAAKIGNERHLTDGLRQE